MSHHGSWLRRLFGTPSPAGPLGGDIPPERIRLRAGSVRRDLRLWEAELAAPSSEFRCRPDEVPHHEVGGGGALAVFGGHGGRSGPPIEQVAAHLRRLRAALDGLPEPPDVSYIRWEGVLRAYDDVLYLACQELGVPTDLRTIGFGRFRDEERARLERILGEVGLPVR